MYFGGYSIVYAHIIYMYITVESFLVHVHVHVICTIVRI